jgi:hypothetical protein
MKKLGLSGDTLIIEGNYITKICETNQQRFIKNIIKQQNFKNFHINPVNILEKDITKDGKNYIKMPLLTCDNALVWLSNTNIDSLKQATGQLVQYFKSIVCNSQVKEFDQIIWNDKLTSLQSQINDPELLQIIQKLFDIKMIQPFYYGESHGDLTLSNIFISQKDQKIEIDAIDFLDSFIFSPMNDFVKMRQDTCHLWTLTLLEEQNNIDKNKVIIFLQYIDKIIKQTIDSDIALKEYYLPFQILNLIRIIPYNKDAQIFTYLKSEIKGLFNEYLASNALCR